MSSQTLRPHPHPLPASHTPVEFIPTHSLPPQAKAKLHMWRLTPIETFTDPDMLATPIKALRVYIGAHKPKIAGVRSPKRREDYNAFFRIWFQHIALNSCTAPSHTSPNRSPAPHHSLPMTTSYSTLSAVTPTPTLNSPRQTVSSSAPTATPPPHVPSPVFHRKSPSSPASASQRSKHSRKRLRVPGPNSAIHKKDSRHGLSSHATSQLQVDSAAKQHHTDPNHHLLSSYPQQHQLAPTSQINEVGLEPLPVQATEQASSAAQLAALDQALQPNPDTQLTIPGVGTIQLPVLTAKNTPLVLEKIGSMASHTAYDPLFLQVLSRLGFFKQPTQAGTSSETLQTADAVQYLTTSELTDASVLNPQNTEHVTEYCEQAAQVALQEAHASGIEPDEIQGQQILGDVPILSQGSCHLLMGGDRSGVQDDI